MEQAARGAVLGTQLERKYRFILRQRELTWLISKFS